MCEYVWWVLQLECSAPLLLHSKEFKYLNEMSEFPSYNSTCPLVVLGAFLSCIIIESESMSRTQSDLKKSKVFGSGMGVCVCPGGGNWQPHVC